MTEQQFIDLTLQLDTLIASQHDLLTKLNSLDFYIGIIVGTLIGLIFWNVAKGVSQ